MQMCAARCNAVLASQGRIPGESSAIRTVRAEGMFPPPMSSLIVDRRMRVDYHWPGLANAPDLAVVARVAHGQQKWTNHQRALQTSSPERYSGYGGDSRW